MEELTRLEPKPSSKATTVLTVWCAASFMATLDVFVVNVAFPAIGHQFHRASLSDLSRFLNGYAIVYAALLVPLGGLADRTAARPLSSPG